LTCKPVNCAQGFKEGGGVEGVDILFDLRPVG